MYRYFFALFLWAQTSYAQNPFQGIGLEEALVLAERYNPQLRAAAAQRDAAVGGIVTARAYPNPDFTTYQGRQYARFGTPNPPGPIGFLQHYSLSQPLDLPWVRNPRIRTAELGLDTSEYALSETRLLLRAAVKESFYRVLRRRADVELAQDNLKLIEDLRRRIAVEVEVGEKARLELTRAEAEVAAARTLVRSAQLRQVADLAQFRSLLGAPNAGLLEPAGELPKAQPLPPLETLTRDLLIRHPALEGARTEISRAQSRLDTERALRRPQPWLHGEYERQPDLGFFRFGLTLPVPLWNRREGPIREAQAALEYSRAVAEQRRLQLTASLERAYGQYEVASQQLAMFELGVLREAEAALRAAESAFKFGERGIIEVLDAQRVLRSVRSDFLNARFDLQSALIELEQLRALDLGGRP